jgi:hypothetical protein
MELELHIICLGDLATGVGDLILRLLILETDKATIIALGYEQILVSIQRLTVQGQWTCPQRCA